MVDRIPLVYGRSADLGPSDHSEVAMKENIKCDFCKLARPLFPRDAVVDGPTKAGPHGYMCEDHFKYFGYPDSSINTKVNQP
jgi:hypothetical protein